jgi:hypothetical protein
MSAFTNNLMSTLFKRPSTRRAAPRQRAALGLEPLEMRAVLATAAPVGNSLPTVPVADLQLDSNPTVLAAQAAARWQQIIIGDLPSAASDSEYRYVPVRRIPSLLGDGSVRPVSYGVNPTTWNALPSTVADDVIVDGRIITGENWDSAHVGGGGGGAGKVQMQDFHFHAFGAAAGGGGGGAGKVSMQDFSFTFAAAAVDPIDVIVGAGAGAPGGHVKALDSTRFPETSSFFAFGNFNGGVYVGSGSPSRGFPGGVSVAAGDVGDGVDWNHHGHGTHVAGTIGASPSGTVHTGAALHLKPLPAGSSAGSTKTAVAVIDTGIDYSHPDLFLNITINQSLERLIDDLAGDASRHHAAN